MNQGGPLYGTRYQLNLQKADRHIRAITVLVVVVPEKLPRRKGVTRNNNNNNKKKKKKKKNKNKNLLAFSDSP